MIFTIKYKDILICLNIVFIHTNEPNVINSLQLSMCKIPVTYTIFVLVLIFKFALSG